MKCRIRLLIGRPKLNLGYKEYMHNSTIKSFRILFVSAVLMLLSAQAWSDVATGRRELDKGNYAAALEQLKPLAEVGNSDAQMLMGKMYANGKGVLKDDVQAAAWYWKAASAGNIEAQLALSGAYADGKGVPRSDDIANFWQWKVADALAAVEKNKLDVEIAKQKEGMPGVLKHVGPVIDLEHCKEPPYRRTGYGYHLSENIQLLFLVDNNGQILEASVSKGSDWPVLDTAFLNSFVKSCTFTPANNNGKWVRGLYALQTGWSVDP
jgi:hypothetical protein